MALLNPCMKFKNYFGKKTSFEALWRWHLLKISLICPRVCQIQDLCRKKYKKGIFSDVQWWKQISTHFSDSTHQECMIFARIGHGPCYYHWNEIFAGVYSFKFLPAFRRTLVRRCNENFALFVNHNKGFPTFIHWSATAHQALWLVVVIVSQRSCHGRVWSMAGHGAIHND